MVNRKYNAVPNFFQLRGSKFKIKTVMFITKNTIYTTFSLFILASLVYAQPIQGVAAYIQKNTFDNTISENMNLPPEAMKRIKNRMNQTVNFELFFDQNESIYKAVEQLDTPQANRQGVRIMRYGQVGSATITHKNLSERRITRQQEFFGKVFLIKDTLKQKDWIFTGNTKTIGRYNAYEATFKRKKRTPIQMRFRSLNDKQEKPENKEVTVSVWFTPEIPVSHGPSQYGGLPGLILMVQDDNTTLVCNKVTLNPENKISLKAPQKGKVVTQKEFSEIMKQKTDEMRERFRSYRSKEK